MQGRHLRVIKKETEAEVNFPKATKNPVLNSYGQALKSVCSSHVIHFPSSGFSII